MYELDVTTGSMMQPLSCPLLLLNRLAVHRVWYYVAIFKYGLIILGLYNGKYIKERSIYRKMMTVSMFFAKCKAGRLAIAYDQKQWFAKVLTSVALRGTTVGVSDAEGFGKATAFSARKDSAVDIELEMLFQQREIFMEFVVPELKTLGYHCTFSEETGKINILARKPQDSIK